MKLLNHLIYFSVNSFISNLGDLQKKFFRSFYDLCGLLWLITWSLYNENISFINSINFDLFFMCFVRFINSFNSFSCPKLPNGDYLKNCKKKLNNLLQNENDFNQSLQNIGNENCSSQLTYFLLAICLGAFISSGVVTVLYTSILR